MTSTPHAVKKGADGSLERPRFDLSGILGQALVSKEGSSTQLGSAENLKGNYVALYFSGHWCPPCRQFTPILIQAYYAAKRAGHPLEVVFVSSDRDMESFSTYYGEMPWHAVPFGDYPVRRKLMDTFKVSGIPSLVILSPDGQVVNANARGEVASDPKATKFPWTGNTDLNSNQGGFLNAPRLFAVLLIGYLVWKYFS